MKGIDLNTLDSWFSSSVLVLERPNRCWPVGHLVPGCLTSLQQHNVIGPF